VYSWAMLENWGKTPVELGLSSWDEVDPWWGDAMLLISEGFETTSKSNIVK